MPKLCSIYLVFFGKFRVEFKLKLCGFEQWLVTQHICKDEATIAEILGVNRVIFNTKTPVRIHHCLSLSVPGKLTAAGSAVLRHDEKQLLTPTVTSHLSVLLTGQLAPDTTLLTAALRMGEERGGEGCRHYLVRHKMSKTTQSTGGFPTEFRRAGEEGGAEGRAESLGQRVEVIWDSGPGGKNSRGEFLIRKM